MRLLKSGVLFFFLLCVGRNSQAQNNPYNEVSIASPTAGALGKYGDIPVNYHTGIPQISVPIYTVQQGPLSLPISLNYHASGLKVLEPASWVGAGWSLDAGGVITRTVQGAPDEHGTNGVPINGVPPTSKGYFSDYGYYSYLSIDDGTGHPIPDAINFTNGIKDGEPDLFFFNFSGYSGKFYFRDDRKIILVPEQDLKIDYQYNGGAESISGFIITIPDGTKYYFGRTTINTDIDPIEMTSPATIESGRIDDKVISSWYLNKIESYDKQFEINLTYIAENYSYHTLSIFPFSSGQTDPSITQGFRLVKNIIHGVRLSEISFDNNKVIFTGGAARQDVGGGNNGLISGDISQEPVNTEAKSLGSIQISNNLGFCKKYNFSYSYFFDNTTPLPAPYTYYTNVVSDRKRLKLTGIQELSCDGTTTVPAYMFDYFTEFVPEG